MGQLLVLLQPWCFFPLFCRNAYIQCITVIVLDNEISKEIKKFKTWIIYILIQAFNYNSKILIKPQATVEN